MNLSNLFKKNIYNEIIGYETIDGWLTEKEAAGLYSIARKVKKNGIVIEIGSWKGKSTFCIAKGLKNGMIFAIDPFNCAGDPDSIVAYKKQKGDAELIDQFDNNMKNLGVSNKVTSLVGYSRDFIDMNKKIDFLFIDGDHSKKECEFDFLNYFSKVIKGGFIAFHDYDANRLELGPTWVINNYVLKNPKFRFYKKFDSLWVCKVIG
jgi:predicted O-methyltransferase YrrM